MDYIKIISMEEIKVLPNSFIWIFFGILAAIIIIPTAVAWAICEKKKKPLIKVFYTEVVAGAIAMAVIIMSFFLVEPHMLVPSGRFKYEVTVDKDRITVSQYEEFLEKYKPEIKGGIYYFEAEENSLW